MTYATLSGRTARPALLLAGILLIAANLRAPITGVAPILGQVRDAFAMGTAEAGALTTLPLLVFAVASPFCVLAARRCGLERSLFLSLILIAGGGLLRSGGSEWMLFAGTAVIGMGIAIANVLLPSLIKRDFPDRIASLTSAYALTAGLVASAVSIMAVPIAELPGSSWNIALGGYVVIPVLAMVVWLPQMGQHSAPEAAAVSASTGGKIWRSALAWQVTLFFGLNSLVYYVIVTWMPQILIEAGYTPAAAGSIHGVSQLATAVPGLLIGPLIARLKDQRTIAFGVVAITAIALAGLMLAPGWATVWAAMFGFGCGATFILALAFISMRVSTVEQAAALSAMAQSVGYLIAAGAPPLIGFLHDRTGGWTVPLAACLAVAGVTALLGLGAGRARQIG